jgi:indole-3-glycerol phosphate synthase
MAASARNADVLETILAATRRIVEVRQSREPVDALRRRAEGVKIASRRFREALTAAPREGRSFNIIAECKRRSPSRGILRRDYDPAAIARGYAGAGAAAISVLTEPTFFDGALDHLAAVRNAVAVPVLRKDFVVSEYQLLEARAAGADAVLLIVAALGQAELCRLLEQAGALGLDVLVEVHDRDELIRAVDAGAAIVGVNNRNLRSLEVNVGVSEDLIARMPRSTVSVSESGLRSAADLRRLSACGYRAFLVGERLMTEPDPGRSLAALVGE